MAQTVDQNKNVKDLKEPEVDLKDGFISKDKERSTEDLVTTETWGSQLEFILACLGYSVGKY